LWLDEALKTYLKNYTRFECIFTSPIVSHNRVAAPMKLVNFNLGSVGLKTLNNDLFDVHKNKATENK
jgi:hypothetical protein